MNLDRVGDVVFGVDTFADCQKLTSVVVSEGITQISRNMFEGCSTLTSVTLPSTIESIGDGAFKNCSALTTVTIPDTVEKITFGYTPFSGCSIVNLASQARLKKLGYTGSF